MRGAGMEIVMVETGDDPSHAPSRAAYERAGFERWPVWSLLPIALTPSDCRAATVRGKVDATKPEYHVRFRGALARSRRSAIGQTLTL